VGSEPADQDVEGGWLVTESCGDLHRWSPFDEDGAEGFITAVEGGSGLEEEVPAELVIHGWSPSINCFRSPWSPERIPCAAWGKTAAASPDS
jgi:hypothetical protein